MIYFVDGFNDCSRCVSQNIIFSNFKFYYNGKLYIFNDDEITTNDYFDEMIKVFSKTAKKKLDTIINLFPEKASIFTQYNKNIKLCTDFIKNLKQYQNEKKDIYVSCHFDTKGINYLIKFFPDINFIRFFSNPYKSNVYIEDKMDSIHFLIKYDDKRIKTIFKNTSFDECKKFYDEYYEQWINCEFEIKDDTFV